MSIKLNFNKLLEARNKAHEKRTIYLEKGQSYKADSISIKIDNLSQIIINEIDNL